MVNSRSSRSLRVKQDSISRVGQSLVRNGFPSQQALAEDLGLTRPTVNNFFTGKQIDRGNFMAICEQLGLDWKEIVEIPPEQQEPRVDWDGAPDVLSFHERIEQRNQLKQWIVEDKCRVIAVLGIGGIGKTSLVKVVAEDIINDFDYVIWRCLTHTPPVEHILLSLIKFISKENFESFDTADQRINQLIDCLKKKRCLIILDNAESIFQQGGNCGAYNDGCKDYETLLQRLSTERHKSCLVLTSRELPANLKPLVGDGLSVRKLQLKSIGRDATQKILRDKGLTPSQKEANQLEEKYSGNPAIINIVASCICDLYSGDIQGFIRSDLFVFNGVQEFLDRQYERLPELEQRIVCWLAILQEPVDEKEIKRIILPILQLTLDATELKLRNALQSLQGRSLIEVKENKYTLPPYVIEYMIRKLIEECQKELEEEKLDVFNRYPLMQAQAREYVQEAQIQRIVKPLSKWFYERYQHYLRDKINNILSQIRKQFLKHNGYAAGNLINLIIQINLIDKRDADMDRLNLQGYGCDFSELIIWEADLRNIHLKNINFSNSYLNLETSAILNPFGGVLSVALSKDGKRLVIGDTSHHVHVYQLKNERLKFYETYEGHTDWVRTVAISPDGQYIASGSEDQTVRIWELATGICHKTLEGYDNRIRSVCFSPDSKLLATGSDDSQAVIWDVESGKRIKTYTPHHNSKLRSVIFTRDGNILIVASEEGYIYLLDNTNDRNDREFQLPDYSKDNLLRTIAVSPDARILATGGDDAEVKLWSLETEEKLTTYRGHTNWIRQIIFIDEGKYLVSCSEDNTIRYWDNSDSVEERCLHILTGHTSRVWSIAFDEVNKILVSVSDDRQIKLWEFPSGKRLGTVKGYTSKLRAITFSPDGRFLASGSDDSTVRLWDWDTQEKPLVKVLTGHEGRVWSVAFSPDGNSLASVSDDRRLKLWGVKDGKLKKNLKQHKSWIRAVAFSPNGEIIASGGDDKILRFYNTRQDSWIELPLEHSDWIVSLCFSPNGDFIVTSSDDRTIIKWDVETRKCIFKLYGHDSPVRAVAVSPNGKVIASGSNDKTIKLWDAETGECLDTSERQREWIRTVAFSVDGLTLASGGYDQMVRLWDIQENGLQLRQTLKGHSEAVTSVAFHPQKPILASGSEDETIKIWNLESYDCLRTLNLPKPYQGLNIRGIQGLNPAQKAVLKALGAVEE